MFKNLESLPYDPIFGLAIAHAQDPHPDKVNLGVGIYRCSEGLPFVLQTIKKSAQEVCTENFEYQLMNGDQTFLQHTAQLYLGEGFHPEKWALQQSVGGTHACFLFGALMALERPNFKVLVGTPTWGNHFALFGDAEFITFDHLTQAHEINMEGYLRAIEQNPGEVLLLHAGAAHNPLGLNFSATQWEIIAQAAQKKDMKVYLDAAYLGFGNEMAQDTECFRIFQKAGLDIAIGISYSKNASLYSERTGVLMIQTPDDSTRKTLESQCANLVRESISNCPQYGAKIMNHVFTYHQNQWLGEIEAIRQDLNQRRQRFIDLFPGKLEYLQNTRGMFACLPVTPDQVEELRTKHHIYMPQNGRINFAGMRERDFEILKPIIKDYL